METAVELRWLDWSELSRIADIDRTERIDVLYDQQGARLVPRHGEWSVPAWDAQGHGEHSVDAKVREVQEYLDRDGVALGALVGGRMVGIGVVVLHLRQPLRQRRRGGVVVLQPGASTPPGARPSGPSVTRRSPDAMRAR